MARGGIDTKGWIAAGAGLVLAVVAMRMPFATAVCSYFLVLVHEMGHAFGYWLYGYPALPAFDFVYGGGVTSHQGRLELLALGIQGGLVWLAWTFRNNPRTLPLAVTLAAGYGFTAWTAGHLALVAALGHGAELVFATIFLQRALSGSACRHDGERPLYAFLGFFIVLYNLRFAQRLVRSSFHREIYEQAKGGGHWMDFSMLAERHLGTSLESVAAAFLVLCLLPPVVSVLVGQHRAALARGIASLLERDPQENGAGAGSRVSPRPGRPPASA